MRDVQLAYHEMAIPRPGNGVAMPVATRREASSAAWPNSSDDQTWESDASATPRDGRHAWTSKQDAAMENQKARQRPIASNSHASILVVEDEQDLQELLEYNLGRDGFNVRCASTGEEGLKAIRMDPPDLVLLDLMLPGIGGLEICRVLRADPQTQAIPIVMLTAKGEEADIVIGLEMGAADYIVKPFSPRVLLARLKAVLRRPVSSGSPDESPIARLGVLVVDADRHEARVAEELVDLTTTEFRIVQLLLRRPGRVFTRAQIVHDVQGDHVAVTDRSVDVHIVSLRRKLGVAGKYIQTVRGVGYRMEVVEGE